MIYSKTPFSEYREEQVRVNIFDYFVTPSFFDQFCDAKPILIYGSRGSGKTTLIKALTISETKDLDGYLSENAYIGIYYRIDLNITASFKGSNIEKNRWEKLFSFYFVCALGYELLNQVIKIQDMLAIQGEKEIAEKFSRLFSGKKCASTLVELKDVIFEQLFEIRDFINNCPVNQFPHIGDYSTVIRELPADIFENCASYNCKNKICFYLIDEFEGLDDWQQRLILSMLKYSDTKHTFKICMRPDGLKTAKTIGGEFISETDDIKSIDLNEKILNGKDGFYKYALDVCKKRMELFYRTNFIQQSNIQFEDLFESFSDEQEVALIYSKNKEKIEKEIINEIVELNIEKKEVFDYFCNNILDFYIFRLMKLKRKIPTEEAWNEVRNQSDRYGDYLHNYKCAIIYYLCLVYSKPKTYAGFKTLVDISGGTLRYLLEICNEIFETAVGKDGFSYDKPKQISNRIQTDAINTISHKRIRQVSAIPEIGINIRTFIVALGKIFETFHRELRISKIEPNHFSIKSSTGRIDDKIWTFLKECVMRGVLIKQKNNKIKNSSYVGSDEYLYILHPIYTPALQISWRRKQKIELSINEIIILIGDNTTEISKLLKEYNKKGGVDINENSDYAQLELTFTQGE